jgi:hypothetical protein
VACCTLAKCQGVAMMPKPRGRWHDGGHGPHAVPFPGHKNRRSEPLFFCTSSSRATPMGMRACAYRPLAATPRNLQILPTIMFSSWLLALCFCLAVHLNQKGIPGCRQADRAQWRQQHAGRRQACHEAPLSPRQSAQKPPLGIEARPVSLQGRRSATEL